MNNQFFIFPNVYVIRKRDKAMNKRLVLDSTFKPLSHALIVSFKTSSN